MIVYQPLNGFFEKVKNPYFSSQNPYTLTKNVNFFNFHLWLQDDTYTQRYITIKASNPANTYRAVD